MKRMAMLAALLTTACGDGPSGPVRAELGGLEVTVAPRPARLLVEDFEGRVLFDGLPGDAPQRGAPPHVALAMRTVAARYEMKFGSFRIEEPKPEPWLGVEKFEGIRKEHGSIGFNLISTRGDEVGTGAVSSGEDGHLRILIGAADPAVNRLSIAFSAEEGEHFLGLGGQSFDVDHRGWTVPMWVQEDGISKVETDEYDDTWFLVGRRHSTHTPMPMLLSSRGLALLLDTPRRSLFALGSEAEEVVRIEAWEGAIDLHLFDGPEPKEALQRMTARVGRPRLPPAFALAPWLDALYGSDNVRRVAQKLRDQDVPASVIWTEDWRGGRADGLGYTLDEDWRVDRDLYPDFEQLADDLHDSGFKFLTYNNTFLSEGVDVWAEAVAGGYTIKNDQGQPYLFQSPKMENASLLDLSNPDARQWARGVYREGLLLGADGYMADYCEWLPTDAVLFSGEDAQAAHNLYPVECQRLNRELFDQLYADDGVERLFFVRSGYLGTQPLVSVFWAGDQQTDFSRGDGLPSVIPMGVGLGICGIPFYGHDIGGYAGNLAEGPTTKELWFRWASLGALSPVMRTHHGKNAQENWNWESDAETLAHLRRWAKLHIRLFPYLYALARQASETGIPIMRPLALDHPEYHPGWTLVDQYMLGDRIYVAPVVEPGAVARTVQLPAGSYYPLEGGPAINMPAGGGSTTVDAPLGECPALVPAGTLLVLLPEEIDTLVGADPDSGTVTLDEVGDDRELWLWPGGQSQLTEVSGLTYSWNAPTLEYPVTRASFNRQAVTVENSTVTVTGSGTLVANDTATLEIQGGAADRRILVRFR
jgi:alpha-glucosidase